MYKTGDIGRFMEDGRIEFFGRKDYQVKVNGFRIELGEIESRFVEYPGIKEAVVICGDDKNGDRYLCAYIVPGHHIPLQELREHLSKQLPAYMIPPYILNLEKIPLNPNGKIDRKALPAPEGASTGYHADYIPPSSNIEKKLVETWKNVLGRNNIGIDENFFLIGGDSIKSIQIISRMSQAGYKLEMRDLFQYPVISDLAPHVKKRKRIPVQSAVTGVIPLTPIQETFFDYSHIEPHHYNLSVMLYSGDGFDKEAVKATFARVLEHHDALRITYRFNAETGDITQIAHGLDFPLSFREYHLKNREDSAAELKTRAGDIQASIDLEKGPLMKLGLFHMDNGDRLLIAVHHLVIDGVSWRILFEDIETLYSRYKNGEKPVLPQKTDPYKLWAEKLSVHADSETFLAEKAYWAQLESNIIPPIPKDFQVEENFVKDARNISFSLEEEHTHLLLNNVNQVFNTEINDILLTALGLGIKKTFGLDRVLIELEGHGREEILDDIDISRTVGWFTGIYPVVLDMSHPDAGGPGRRLKEIKETLRRVPNKGIGYRILKHLTGEENKRDIDFKLDPRISFNYMGQFDADLNRASSFEIAKERAGNTEGLKNKREHELVVNGITAGNRLTVAFAYNETHFKPGTMALLAGNVESELKDIISFCRSKENTEFTPSDFTYKGLSIESVDRLTALYPDIEDLYTLSPMQEGMLFHSLLETGSSVYFEQFSFRLNGDLDILVVEKSLNRLLKRYDILRTTFIHEDFDRPLQVVPADRRAAFYFKEIDHGGRDEQTKYIEDFKKKDRKRSFDLSKDVLMRVSILKIGPAEYEFIWSFHHILMDGWCVGILIQEFFEIYSSYLENRPSRLSKVTQYRTYIQWLEKQDKKKSKEYWKKYLGSYRDLACIPGADDSRLSEKEYINIRTHRALSKEKTGALNEIAGKYNVTLSNAVQAIWGIILGKYNNTPDVVFGAVVSGRSSEIEGIESMVGLFINTIPVRINCTTNTPFNELLLQVQTRAIDSEPHHYYPLAEVQAHSSLKQNLFDHILIFDNYPAAGQIDGMSYKSRKGNGEEKLKLSHTEAFEQTNYDFNVIVIPGAEMRIGFSYNGNVYPDRLMEEIFTHFDRVLIQILNNPLLPVDRITLLSPEEKEKLLFKFNDTGTEFPGEKTIHQLFEEQEHRTPDHTAVIGVGDSLTYRELNKRANRLAHRLREKQVKPDTIVGIMMERSIHMLVGIIGILKAGGAYLPMDPAYPAERNAFMLMDSRARIILTQKDLVDEHPYINRCISPGEIVLAEDDAGYPGDGSNPEPSNQSKDAAYLIYTSGSTGKPKGTPVTHRNVNNYSHWFKREFQIGQKDKFCFTGSFCFDMSVTSLLVPLISGASIYTVKEKIEREPQVYTRYLAENKISIIKLTPTQFKALKDFWEDEDLNSLRYIILGGEAVDGNDVRDYLAIYNHQRIVNEYGPTEATVATVFHVVSGNDFGAADDFRSVGSSLPIGRPIFNTGIYILDKYTNAVPVRVVGELCIAGESVVPGYLNKPELTAEKFITFHRGLETPPIRIYRTGDLARWRDDGNIEYLGRTDSQVKIKGYRIEPDEIEAVLAVYEGLKAGVIAVKKDAGGNGVLVAYVIPKENETTAKIREYLGHRLPGYMVPSLVVAVKELPVAASGKVDRKKLPGLSDLQPTGSEPYREPTGEKERILANTWEGVLGVNSVGIDDNFFQLGGDSIKAIQVVSRLRKYKYTLKISDLFLYPTVKQLNKYMKKLEKAIDQGPVKGEVELTPIQEWFFEKYFINSNNNFAAFQHYNQSVMIYRREGFNRDAVELVFRGILLHHDALRMVYSLKKGKVAQRNRELEGKLFKLETMDLHDAADINTNIEMEIQRAANRLQRGMDLLNGPLVRLGLFKTNQGDYLLIAIHHLVMDGVSWRILLEDFSSGYQQAVNHQPVKFQEKTDSFQYWAAKLKEYAELPEALKELEYWKRLKETGSGELPVDHPLPAGQSDQKKWLNREIVTMELPEIETGKLLRKVNRPYRTENNDILLAALGLAIKEWGGLNRVSIHLEGHGREEILEGVSISRTVGWFTTLFPVTLDLTLTTELSYFIKQIKETLRQIPGRGIGYGILKYLTGGNTEEITVEPAISFNYLGEFGQDHHANPHIFEFSHIKSGDNVNPQLKGLYHLDINGMVVSGKLILSFGYNKYEYKRSTIERLVECCRSNLGKIVEHCMGKKQGELTPSDLTYRGFTIDELSALENRFREKQWRLQDIYGLSPMQSGMHYYYMMNAGTSLYFEQYEISIQGEIDRGLLEKSFNVLLTQFDILRTVFVHEGFSEPMQIVIEQRNAHLQFKDVSKLQGDVLGAFIETFKQKDRAAGFDLAGDLLVRLALLKTGPGLYTLLWSFHHIIMDGWCIGIIFKYMMRIYTALLENQPVIVEPVKPYREFIKWLEKQDGTQAMDFWKAYLEGYENRVELPKHAQPGKAAEYKNEEHRFYIPQELSRGLAAIGKINQVTLNTVLQTLWGILLQKVNKVDDVVFGAVVSGRPQEIEAVENMVGLFINTVPVRIKLEERGQTFGDLIGGVQQKSLVSKSYEYLSLAEIESYSPLKDKLVDHIVVFENYPVQHELSRSGNRDSVGFDVLDIDVFEQNNYDFSMIVEPGETINIKFSYNSNVYGAVFVKKIASYFSAIVKQVVDSPDIEIEKIELISPVSSKAGELQVVEANILKEDQGDFGF